MQELVREARKAGAHDSELYEVLSRRSGLVGAERLADLMRAGRERFVLEFVRTAVRPA